MASKAPTGKTAEHVAARMAYTDDLYSGFIETQESIIDDLDSTLDDIKDLVVDQELDFIAERDGLGNEFDDVLSLEEDIGYLFDDQNESDEIDVFLSEDDDLFDDLFVLG